MQSAWLLLFVAGIFEVCWAVCLKLSHGLTRIWPSVFMIIALALSMLFLAKASEKLPLGTAYAVWVGIGALGAALAGIFLFQESTAPIRLFFLGLLLLSIIGLKVTA